MKKEVIDDTCTTKDWQVLSQPIAVLPVGSLEQHGGHLPLNTDTVEAEYFARLIAEDLGAALLPALSFGQSLEHKGFRGTVSLRADTLKSLVFDITNELESQNFTRLVIVNAHGGNFALAQAVRQINREDRSIKVVLVNFWEADESDEGKRLSEKEVHAGAWETSVMLAIAPELVGDYLSVRPLPFDASVRQSDLNHFGIGFLRPGGVWGNPADASVQAGEVIVSSIAENLLKAVRERLEWFNEQSCYYGSGDVVVRQMQSIDLDAGLRLSMAAGWNQLEADWRLFYGLNPAGAFVAVHNGRVVGTITTPDYMNEVGWIGMVLVDAKMQRRGIATRLMKTAIDSLAHIKTLKLDATAAGREVYKKLGFNDEFGLTRFAADMVKAPDMPVEAGYIRPMTASDVESVAKMDALALGVMRKDVIEGLLGMGGKYAFVCECGNAVTGFVMGRGGARSEYIGPLVASDLRVAQSLCCEVLKQMEGKAVAMDTPDAAQQWNQWLQSLGMSHKRTFVRMYRGLNPYRGKTENMYAIAGPELG